MSANGVRKADPRSPRAFAFTRLYGAIKEISEMKHRLDGGIAMRAVAVEARLTIAEVVEAYPHLFPEYDEGPEV